MPALSHDLIALLLIVAIVVGIPALYFKFGGKTKHTDKKDAKN